MITKLKIKLSVIIVSVLAITVISGATLYAIKTNSPYIGITPLELPGNGEGAGVHDVKIHLKSGVEFKQDTCKVYKFKKNAVTPSDVSSLAKIAGLDSEVKNDSIPNRYSVQKGKETFWMEKDTGKWAYEDLSKLYKSPNGSINLPNDKETLKIAEKQLEKMGLKLSSFDSGIVVNQTEQGAAEATPTTIEKDVFFYKKFNGEPLLGVSRVIVTIGDNGEIHAIRKFFRDIDETPHGTKLKPIEKAMDDAKNGKGMVKYSGKGTDIKDIEISSVKLVYWENPTNDYLQPVYVLNGYNKDSQNDLYEAYVTAIEGN